MARATLSQNEQLLISHNSLSSLLRSHFSRPGDDIVTRCLQAQRALCAA